MTMEVVKSLEKRKVLVGVRIDDHTKELLDWALVKVAHPGDTVVALHVCRCSDAIVKGKQLLDDYLVDYEGLCTKKQVELKAEVLKGCSIKKVLVREAKKLDATAVVLGISKHSAIGGWLSIAKYCTKRLPVTIEVMAIHNGKVVFRNNPYSQFAGSAGDPRPSVNGIDTFAYKQNQSEFGDSEISDMARLSRAQTSMDEGRYGRGNEKEGKHDPVEDFPEQRPGWPLLRLAGSTGDKSWGHGIENSINKENRSEFDDSETSKVIRLSHEVTQSSEDEDRDRNGNAKEETSSHVEKQKRASLSSISHPIEDFTKQRPGWPLLQSTGSITKPALEARGMSVVRWVMSLPSRSLLEANQGGGDNHLEKKHEINSPDITRFSREVLETSTSEFSPEYLIGRGGNNRVYKGNLPGGKAVAVKIMKSSKEGWKNFTLEVDIMSTLKHQNITPLLGICVEDYDLISVYDFFWKGNLEENLHKKTVFPWEARFKIAVGVAEALNYLHNECPRPIIHRDVKSSNILLTHEFEPQLSDFGLAIWGPTAASYLTHSDVVGTFGYLAPEYFMYGKVSDKLDVYAFGVVILELLSGRKPIGFDTPKGQESLVMWARPKLESGDTESILDPKLDNNVDKHQMQRMCLAAKLCLTQAARLRPNMIQILKILKGEKEDGRSESQYDSENQDINDDEVYPDSSAESHLSLAFVDIASDDNSSTSFSSLEQSSPHSLEELFKGRWSRSSSLD